MFSSIKKVIMHNINLWGYTIPCKALTPFEVDYLSNLPTPLPSLEWVWSEMDRVWDLFNLNNTRPLRDQAIGDFYSHPVWLMNGIFTEMDPVSSGHRSAIASYLIKIGASNIADYGGGWGALAQAVVKIVPECKVSIIEPFPSRVALDRMQNESRIAFIDDFTFAPYNVVIAQDVLEHVEDPVALVVNLVNAVEKDGYLIFANCFNSCIKCHLPATFYLRYQFKLLMKYAGLHFIEVVPGAEHAQVFRKKDKMDHHNLIRANKRAKRIGFLLNSVNGVSSIVKHKLLNL